VAPNASTYRLQEVPLDNPQDTHTITVPVPSHDNAKDACVLLSPHGDRVLWLFHTVSVNAFASRIERFTHHNFHAYSAALHIMVTDLRGANLRDVGTVDGARGINDTPGSWCPDGKHICFFCDNKLYRIAVP
jgi:hypothetical protein